MSIKPDHWIRKMCQEHRMIEPFEEKQVRAGVISYGVSSYGYDIRIAEEFKIFTNVNSTIVDPKNMDPGSMVDFKGPVAIIPPNSFALGRTVEYFRIPRNVLTLTVGKCLSGDTQVVDASSGRPVRIDEQRGGRVAALRSQSIRPADVTETSIQGAKPIYEVVTRTGRKIRATSNHPFLTYTGWKELSDLGIGSRIGVSRRVPIFGNRTLRPCEVELLGLMISDGQCFTPGSSPRYTSGDPVLRARFCDLVSEFGCVPKPVAGVSVNATNRGRRGGIMERNRMTVWLESLGLAVRSPEKSIPWSVYELNRDQLALFLRALFSGDGGISFSENAVHLEFYSTSESLARGVQHLLLRFGIVAHLRPRMTTSGRLAYNLCVTSKDQVIRFAREIGFIPETEKQKRLDAALEKIRLAPQKRSNFDTLPREAWHTLRMACRARGVSLRKLEIERTAPQQSLSRELALEVAHKLDDERLASIADSDVLWDTIVSLRYVGWEPVFDLTVPETANFVANDFIVHNSTYARCGIITNVTPFEPEWEGFVTLEISNTTPLPAKIYANEGIAQVLFFESDDVCEVSYGDRAGKYQGQVGITLPKL